MNKPIFLIAFMAMMHFTASVCAADNSKAPFADKALEIYRNSISMRTAEGRGMVPILANYLADIFREGGFNEGDIHALAVEETAVLIVRYRGNGSSGKKPISISAHMDVVDALPEDWERDPFTLVEESGYFFGRGTSDDKLGMTAVTVAFLRLKAEGYVPNRDLIIAFSGDEETGMVSTRALVHEFRDLTDSEFVLNADAGGATIPEGGGRPASFGMQAAEKTYATWELTVTNPGGHSSRPRDDNAIYELVDALKKIQDYKFPVRYNALTLNYFKGTGVDTPGDLGEAMRIFADNPQDEWAIETLRADPSIVGTTGTTCVTTMLRAGHAENALPQSATATVNCRIFPGEGVDATMETLQGIIGNDAVRFVLLQEATETDPSPLREDIEDALQQAIDIKYPDLKIIPSMSSGGTDGMHFRAAGIPSYGVNGQYGKSSDSFAHGLNERITVETFYDNLAHWYVLLKAITE